MSQPFSSTPWPGSALCVCEGAEPAGSVLLAVSSALFSACGGGSAKGFWGCEESSMRWHPSTSVALSSGESDPVTRQRSFRGICSTEPGNESTPADGRGETRLWAQESASGARADQTGSAHTLLSLLQLYRLTSRGPQRATAGCNPTIKLIFLASQGCCCCVREEFWVVSQNPNHLQLWERSGSGSGTFRWVPCCRDPL